MTAEQLREIESRCRNREPISDEGVRLIYAPVNADIRLLLSEVYRLRHQCMECESFGKVPTHCEYAKNGPRLNEEGKEVGDHA